MGKLGWAPSNTPISMKPETPNTKNDDIDDAFPPYELFSHFSPPFPEDIINLGTSTARPRGASRSCQNWQGKTQLVRICWIVPSSWSQKRQATGWFIPRQHLVCCQALILNGQPQEKLAFERCPRFLCPPLRFKYDGAFGKWLVAGFRRKPSRSLVSPNMMIFFLRKHQPFHDIPKHEVLMYSL